MRPIIVHNDLGRTDRSVAAVAAHTCDTSTLNTLLHISAGPVRAILSPKRADQFQLEAMNNRRAMVQLSTTFTQRGSELVSVEARSDVHSGISSFDRATTISVLGSREPNPRDLVSPGHVFPRLGAKGGLLERADAYQGALEYFSQLESGADVAVACVDLLDAAGEIADSTAVAEIAKRYDLQIISLSELVRHKLASAPLITREAESTLPIAGLGTFSAVLFRDQILGREHLALVRGNPTNQDCVVVRVHRKAILDDIFGERTTSRLRRGLERIANAKVGVLVYLDAAAALPTSANSYEPMRDFAIGAQILVALKVKSAHVLTDSPKNLVGSTIFGVEIAGQEALSKH